jgi:hypothetical protein
MGTRCSWWVRATGGCVAGVGQALRRTARGVRDTHTAPRNANIRRSPTKPACMLSCDLAAGVYGRGELARCDLLPLLCLVHPQAWSAASGPLRSERGSAGGPAGAAVVVARQVPCRRTLPRVAAAAAVAAYRPTAPARVWETEAGRKRRLPSRGLVEANASATRTASTTLVRVVRVHVEPVGGGGGELVG